jgi:hypothetical protein
MTRPGILSPHKITRVFRKDAGVCEHRCMMPGELSDSRWKVLIVPVVIILLIVLVLARVHSGRG